MTKKKWVISTVMVILGVGGYWYYKNSQAKTGEITYQTGQAKVGTLTVSISGSGQVSSSNQVDIKPSASGKVTAVYKKQGDSVKEGEIIAQLDASDVYKSVRDAETSLQSAQLSLQKIQQPVEELSLTQAQNSLEQAKQNLEKSQNDLKKSYEDTFNTIANAFIDLPKALIVLNDALYNTDIGKSQGISDRQENLTTLLGSVLQEDSSVLVSMKSQVEKSFTDARNSYNDIFNEYKNTTRQDSEEKITTLLLHTTETTRKFADAIKSEIGFYGSWKDLRTKRNLPTFTKADQYFSDLSTNIGLVNNDLSSLIAANTSITSGKNLITSNQQSINEKTLSLAKITAGTDKLDIESAKLNVVTRQNALNDAKSKYADYTIKAPFTGTLATLTVKKNDTVSSGTSLGTEITKQKFAEIQLNEVDAAKVKQGQKATLTFDALDGLSLAGQVATVDSIGTVTQNVVNYKVAISIDSEDDRIKPGMSVNSAIITDIVSDVVLIPNNALHADNQGSYIQKLENGVPVNYPVTVGLSNDSETVVLTGLNDGDLVVTQTIDPAKSTTSSTQQRSLFGGNAGFGGAGAAVRVGGGR